MSYKNSLQEHCQKNSLQLPQYNTIRCGGTDNAPIWQSTVTINEQTYKGLQSNNRKAAEQNAAAEALQYINSSEFGKLEQELKEPSSCFVSNYSTTQTYDLSENICVLIDLENIQPNIQFNSQFNQLNINIYGFLSSFSTINTDKYKGIINICKINSAVKDAADHLMTFTAASLVYSMETDEISNTHFVILSRDTSSSVLVQLLQNTSCKKVTHFTQTTDFEKFLIIR